MPDAPISAEPARPDPAQDRQGTGAGVASRVTRLLVVVRWLIDFGTRCADCLREGNPSQEYIDTFAFRFRTRDMSLILARITRGLLLAAGLEAKLADIQARGRDISRAPPPRDAGGRSGRGPGKPRPPRPGNIIDLPLDRLPTAQEIAEELRRRPIGAVLVDICRDLSIGPQDMSGPQWRALYAAVIEYGGSLVTWTLGELNADIRAHLAALQAAKAVAPPAPPAPPSAPPPPCSTGPPGGAQAIPPAA